MSKRAQRRVYELRSIAATLLRLANESEEELVEQIPAGIRAHPKTEVWTDVTRQIILAKTIELYRERRRRERIFSFDIFGEPAWDILLDLFSCHLQSKRISVTSVCIAANVAPTTALRWVSELEEIKLIERFDSETDRRVKWVRLTDSASKMMLDYFKSIEDDKIQPSFDLEGYLIDGKA